MKKRLFIWGLAVLTAANIAALTTFGYHRFSEQDGGHERQRVRRISLKERLGLTDLQAEQMEATRKSLDERIKPLRVALGEKREYFFQLMVADRPDRMKIDAVQTEMDSLQAEIKRLVIDHMLAQREILTPEQQKQYFSMIRNRYDGAYGGNHRRR